MSDKCIDLRWEEIKTITGCSTGYILMLGPFQLVWVSYDGTHYRLDMFCFETEESRRISSREYIVLEEIKRDVETHVEEIKQSLRVWLFPESAARFKPVMVGGD